MRKTYKILTHVIAALVVVQAASIVYGVSGLFNWVVNDGGTLDAGVVESWENDPPTFEGAIGHFIHMMSGTYLIPLVAVILLVVAFFAKVPRGVPLAAAVLLAIALQVTLGIVAAGGVPISGLFHGLNAFIVFSLAIAAGRATKAPATIAT